MPKATSTSKWKVPFIAENILSCENGSKIPFMAITESWLKGYITDAQIKIPHYNAYRSDRSKRQGGGTLLYIHEDLIVSSTSSYDDNTCEAIICTIENIDTVIASVYRPPKASEKDFANTLKFLEEYILSTTSDKPHDIFITGDFNLPNINWESLTVEPAQSHGKEMSISAGMLLEFVNENFLTQIVDKSTRGRNTLDLILTNNVQLTSEVNTRETSLSDHDIVEVGLRYNPFQNSQSTPPKQFDPHSFSSVKVHECNYEDMNDHLATIDWHMLSDLCKSCIADPDGSMFFELVRLTVLQLTLIHAPAKEVPSSNKTTKVTRQRKILNRKRRKLQARLNCLKQHQPSSPTVKVLEDQLSLLYVDIRDSIAAELHSREERAVKVLKSNPRYFFSYAKRFSKVKSNVGPLKDKDGILHQDPEKMANILQQQYTSVFSNPESSKAEKPKMVENDVSIENIIFTTEDIIRAIDSIDAYAGTSDEDIPARVIKECKQHLCIPIKLIWSRSLHSETVPSILKTQFITPVFKKGNRSDPGNYRPISLTSHIIKIFERILRQRLVTFLEGNKILNQSQHGFRKGRSCLTQLLSHYDRILQNLNNNCETDVIYLDYAKAFDKVDHRILLQKLHAYGIRGKLYNWIKDFLSNRHQTVVINGKHSLYELVISGVPQGSVLGPLLFIIYINDLEKDVKDSKISSFADDTRAAKDIACVEDTEKLQADLDRIVRWSEANNMQLHEDKFEFLCYRTKQSSLLKQLPSTGQHAVYQTPKGHTLYPQEAVKDLGVILASDYSWSYHINTMVADARIMAAWVLGVFKDRSYSTMLQLYKTMVRSRLEYCCPLWSPHKIQDIQTIEAVQKAFTKKIGNMKDLDYWDRLRRLNITSLQRRRERYIIIHIFKIINDMAPNDLCLEWYNNKRLGIKVKIPKLDYNVPKYAFSLMESSFRISGAKLWNLLPAEVNTQHVLDPFKIKLQTFLKKFPDKPPVYGYTTQNGNSLIDWSMQSGGPQLK
jgi:hypothetical protein